MQFGWRALSLLGLLAVAPTQACMPSRSLAAPLPVSDLLAATRTLAAVSGCRILLAPGLAARSTLGVIAADTAVADALDQLSARLELNWTQQAGDITFVAAAAAGHAQTAAALTIEATTDPHQLPAPIEQARTAGERSPAIARTQIADARFAAGDKGALEKGLIDAIQSGADTGPLREAIELVDGSTELSPYRIDGRKITAAYEASKASMPAMQSPSESLEVTAKPRQQCSPIIC